MKALKIKYKKKNYLTTTTKIQLKCLIKLIIIKFLSTNIILILNNKIYFLLRNKIDLREIRHSISNRIKLASKGHHNNNKLLSKIKIYSDKHKTNNKILNIILLIEKNLNQKDKDKGF